MAKQGFEFNSSTIDWRERAEAPHGLFEIFCPASELEYLSKHGFGMAMRIRGLRRAAQKIARYDSSSLRAARMSHSSAFEQFSRKYSLIASELTSPFCKVSKRSDAEELDLMTFCRVSSSLAAVVGKSVGTLARSISLKAALVRAKLSRLVSA